MGWREEGRSCLYSVNIWPTDEAGKSSSQAKAGQPRSDETAML